MHPFTERVVAIIRSIPAGRVMSYGQIASTAGSPSGARQVVRILHSLSEPLALPWHRVVNAQGRIAFADEEAHFTQRTLLQQEGVELDEQGRLNLEKYRFVPGDSCLPFH